MFELLNPAYLFGLTAAAIPLIIHLSRSRRPKKMRFSTTRFFTDQFLRSYRMSRLKELLLLACRMLLFGLFAFALAQPLVKPKNPTAAGGSDAERTVVIVLDNSASMGYTEDGVTLLERARKSARRVIEGLGKNDAAAIVLAGRRAEGPEAPLPEPSHERGQVLQTLDRVAVSSLGTDLTAAIRRAELIALSATTSHKEVYVFSDLQDSGWELTDKGRSDTSQVSFFFVRVRPQERVRNVGVTAVQFASPRPMAGVPFTIRPLLTVQDPDEDDRVVRLFVDGQKVGEQPIRRLAGGRWDIPRFTHTFTTGGWHSGHIEVQDKTLPQDNRRYFALEVLDRVNVLAVNGAPSAVPRLDELFFLKLALTVSPQEGQKSPITVDTVSPGALAEANLAKYPLVILANVESLPEAAVAKLEEFADKGGSVLFFLGDKVNRTFYNETLAGGNRRNSGLLPGKLLEREGDPADAKDVATVGAVNYDHPALSAFQDPRFASLGGRSVTFKALWRMEVPSAAVLMKASTGAALLAEKSFGRGRVLVFTSTCDRDWTNFPIRPAFLPWIHRLVAHLAQEPLGHQAFYQTGSVARLPAALVKGNTAPLVKKPNGTAGYGSLEEGDDPALLFADTEQPGIYTLLTPDQKGTLGLFAVNLESYESDLTYLDDVLAPDVEAGLKDLMKRNVVAFVDDPEQVTETAATVRSGTRLWDLILLFVLAIALFEPWLANRISLRHYGKPRHVPVLAGPEGAQSPRPLTERPAEEVRS
jgi:hypothetical protein